MTANPLHSPVICIDDDRQLMAIEEMAIPNTSVVIPSRILSQRKRLHKLGAHYLYDRRKLTYFCPLKQVVQPTLTGVGEWATTTQRKS